MNRKPEKRSEEDTKKRWRKKKTKQTITRAVTHIRLGDANPGKLAALDQLMAVYLPLCQQYVTLLCTQEASPDKYSEPVFSTEISERLHRVAIQQAAGIARILAHQPGERLPGVPGRCGRLRQGQSQSRDREPAGHLQKKRADLEGTSGARPARARPAGQCQRGRGRAIP